MRPAEEHQAGDSILLGEDEHGTVIRAVGHIRANECFTLREGIFPALESASSDKELFVDLSVCTYMDSTFIGLLVAMDKKIRRARGKRLRLFNPTPECLDSLLRLGLDKILVIENGAFPFPLPVPMRVLAKAEKPGPEFILKTHQALMETSAEAKKKFSLVVELLAKKIRGE
jgi:anti-anti-sigma factor